MRADFTTEMIKKYITLPLFGILFFVCGTQIVNAQKIHSAAADGYDTVLYADTVQVPVFVFNTPLGGQPRQGVLTAYAADAGQQNDIVWQRFNTGNLNYEQFAIGIGAESTQNNLGQGGYRVIITDTANRSDTLLAWVFQNEFDVAIVNKNSSGKVRKSSVNCNYFDLDAQADLDSLEYYDLLSGSYKTLFSEVAFVDWSHETEDAQFPKIDEEDLRVTVRDPLVEDAIFFLTVRDKYGAERHDTIEMEAIAVRAEFEIDTSIVKFREPTDFYKRYHDSELRTAPNDVEFRSLSSSKVDSVFWRFDDDSTAHGKDTLVHTYYFPGDYYPTLIVVNEKGGGCVDSTTLEEGVSLEDVEFEMPNIFEIGSENVFRSFDVSVVSIEIVIFSRWGQKVHEYAGDITNWRGWDGKIKGTDRYVKTGVYYYAIRMLRAFDTAGEAYAFDKKVKTGFVHVFNYDE
jgi:hypothetical protein